MVDAVEHAGRRRRPGCRLAEIQATWLAVWVVPKINGDLLLVWVHIHGDLDRDPIGDRGKRVMLGGNRDPSARAAAQGLGHSKLAVVKPLVGEPFQQIPPELAAELDQAPLADPGGAENGQVITPPLVWDTDAQTTRPDQVFVGLVVALRLDARDD